MEVSLMSDLEIIASIIIPVYNVELYLKECLDSIFVNQDIRQKFEVIIVNDGSTDS
jgi:glycosyltransferase involved in cell wall biosynthesis